MVTKALDPGGDPVPGRRSAATLQKEACYAELQDRIVRVQLRPGDQIVEDELRQELGFGASPFREAVRRLEYEQLVTVHPRRGTFVAGLDLKSARDLMQLRCGIESVAASLASQRASAKERQALVDLAEQQLAATDLYDCVDLDAQFHDAIYLMSRNAYVLRTARMHFNIALRNWYYCAAEMSEPDWTTVDHRELAEAVVDGQEEKAASLIQEHIVHDTQSVISILTAYGL